MKKTFTFLMNKSFNQLFRLLFLLTLFTSFSQISTASPLCDSTLDSDGDGVPDDCDLDDDNDGILDINECTTSNFFWSNPPSISGNTATGTINGIGYTYTSSENVTSTSSIYNHGIFPAHYSIPNVNPTIQNIYVTSNTLTFSSPMTNPVLVFASIGNSGTAVPITFSNPVEVLWSSAVTVNSPTKITGVEGYAIVRMNGTFSSISFKYEAAENWVNFAFGADFYTYCDTDGDGITDNLDLDSDNDGCYDALEGSMGLNASQISNGSITGGVDANGVPLLVGSQGQGKGTSTDYSISCFCDLGIDNTLPVVKTKDNTVYLDASGHASITPQAVDNGSSDNCGSVSLSLNDMTFDCSDMNAKNVATIVSDNTWSQSTVELTTPSQYVSVVNQLPNVSTYTLPASNAWPYGTVNFFSPPIPDALPIYANGGTKFYRNEFQLTGRPQSLRIRARVDNMMEIFVNGVSIGMEDDVDGANFSNTVYHDVYIDDNGVQNGYLGGMQFDFVTSQSILDLLHEGSNEIVFAIANTNGTDQGGFMVRMDAVADGVPVVLTAVDTHGNSSNATAFVVVKDSLAPTITTQPIFLTLPATGTVTITADDVATVTDNCSVPTVELSQYVFGFNDALNSPVSVIVTATDASGNITVSTAQVNVDYPAPTVSTQDITVQLDANGEVTITPQQVDNGSSSIAGPVDLSLNISSFDCSTASISKPDYALSFDGTNDHVVVPANAAFESTTTTFQTWIKPFAGNTNQALVSMRTSYTNARYSLHINQALGKIGIFNGSGYYTISYPFQVNAWYHITAVITPGYTDFYVNATYQGRLATTMNASVTGATVAIGSTNDLAYTFEHLSGELDDIRFWNDVRTAQEIFTDMNTPLNGDEQGLVAYYTMSDGPGSATLTDHSLNGFNGTLAYMDNQNDWTAGLYGPTTTDGNIVTLTATDPYGKTATSTATVTVIDNLQPVITIHPIEVTLAASGTVEITAEDVSTVTDNCEVTSVELSQYLFGANDALNSPVTVIVTATDASGNTSSQPVEVTVIDPAPVALCQDIIVELDENGVATITPEMVDNGSTSVVGIAGITLDNTSFDCSNTGANSVTLTVTSTLGSTATCNATVTVVDYIAPVITSCPGTIQVNNTPSVCGATVNYQALATDNCSAVISYSIEPGSMFPVGLTTVLVTATDPSGNAATCSFDVEVIDTELPTISCPFDIVVNAASGTCGALVNYQTPTGTDNCGTTAPPTSLAGHTYKGIFNGHSYFLSNGAYPPETAHANALASGGHLATVSSYQENQFISGLYSGRMWIGFNDRDQEGSWEWITNEPVVYTNWSGGEPNNAGGNEDWAVINWAGPTWNDWYYTQPAYYVIEFDGGTLPATLIAGLPSGSVFPVGNNVVTYEVVDPSGNRVECSFNIKVNDNQPPVALTNNLTIQLDETGSAVITAVQIDNGSTDNCGIASIIISKSTFDCSNVGPNNVLLTVTDVNGNVSTATAVVTVEDNVAPVAVAQNITVQLNALGSASITPTQIDNGSSDACGIASIVLSQTDFDCSNVGLNTVTLTVTDIHGNVATANSVVTVQDITAPNVVAQDVVVQLDENGYGFLTPEMVDNGSTDECGIASMSLNRTEFSCTNIGEDVAGVLTAKLTVDNQFWMYISTSPTVEGTLIGANANWPEVTTHTANLVPGQTYYLQVKAEDVGGPEMFIGDFSVTGSFQFQNGLQTLSTNAANWTLSETGFGNNPQTPIDLGTTNFSPIWGVTPGISANARYIWKQPWNTTGGEVVYFSTPVLFSGVVNEAILTVTDVNGNASSQTVNVTVEDNIAPIALAQDITIQLDAAGQASITSEMINNGSTDACGIASLALDKTTFDCSNVGANNVTLTVTDVNGNVSTATAIVTVEDNVAPVVITQNVTIQLDANGQASVTAIQINNVSTDACGIASLALDKTNFDCSNVGMNTVTLTVTDVNGNVSTGTAVVTVEDHVAPSLVVPASITQLNDTGVCGAVINIGLATAADNCAIATIVNNAPVFFPVGTTTVTWTATDVNGNATSANQTVTVTNNNPVINMLTVSIPVLLGDAVVANATFTDNNVVVATWHWGDGSTSSGVIGTSDISGDHVYATTGLYDVKLVIEDACGKTDEETFSYTVVFNPCAGHVTGGGWINLNPGSYPAKPTLISKATFEFELKYDGNSIDGHNSKIKFQIKETKFEFRSSVINWLMVNNDQAIFSGTGTINGSGNYTFVASVIDGDVVNLKQSDYFRIVIKDMAGNVVFDNQAGSVDAARAAQKIDQGSIQIHKGKCKEKDDDHGDKDDDDDDKKDDGKKSASIITNDFNVTLYPNPVRSKINLKVQSMPEGSLTIEIFDMTGRAYMKNSKVDVLGGQVQVNVSNVGMVHGNYIMRVIDNESLKSVKVLFIKE